MLNVRIEGYDDYVKDFKQLCVKLSFQIPLLKETLIGIVTDAYENYGIEEVEELGKIIQRLSPDSSIDGKEHLFCLLIEVDENEKVRIRYVSERGGK